MLLHCQTPLRRGPANNPHLANHHSILNELNRRLEVFSSGIHRHIQQRLAVLVHDIKEKDARACSSKLRPLVFTKSAKGQWLRCCNVHEQNFAVEDARVRLDSLDQVLLKTIIFVCLHRLQRPGKKSKFLPFLVNLNSLAVILSLRKGTVGRLEQHMINSIGRGGQHRRERHKHCNRCLDVTLAHANAWAHRSTLAALITQRICIVGIIGTTGLHTPHHLLNICTSLINCTCAGVKALQHDTNAGAQMQVLLHRPQKCKKSVSASNGEELLKRIELHGLSRSL